MRATTVGDDTPSAACPNTAIARLAFVVGIIGEDHLLLADIHPADHDRPWPASLDAAEGIARLAFQELPTTRPITERRVIAVLDDRARCTPLLDPRGLTADVSDAEYLDCLRRPVEHRRS